METDMTHIIELPKDSFIATIGKDLEMTVDVTKVPVNVLWHYIERELTDDLRDSHASVTRDSFSGDDAKWREAKMAVAEKKLAALYAGTIRAAKAPSAPIDPVGAEALRMARVKINGLARGWEKDDSSALANIAAWAAKLGLPNVSADDRKAVIAKAIEANAKRDDVIAAAKVAVEALKTVKAAIAVDDIL
jgi:hypothetical protein